MSPYDTAKARIVYRLDNRSRTQHDQKRRPSQPKRGKKRAQPKKK
jgi:hypothetical protein